MLKKILVGLLVILMFGAIVVGIVEKMADGKAVQIGLGPSHYRDSQGFTIRAGDQIQANGYWEDDEFKAVQAVNLTTGTQITLRDASGRPMWAGWGRRK